MMILSVSDGGMIIFLLSMGLNTRNSRTSILKVYGSSG